MRRWRTLSRKRRGAAKGNAEIAWWLDHWDSVIREGGYFPGDVLDLLDSEEREPSYEGRRWQIARAEVVRVLHEAAIADLAFFHGKTVVDIGPGPLGFPDACPAGRCFGIDPLADRYREAGLLLESDAIYLSVGAESVPLPSSSADVVVARNSLDHVDNPEQVVKEALRLLANGGTLILNFDEGHTPTPTEPHSLSASAVRKWISPLRIVHEDVWDTSHGHDGNAVVIVAEKSTER